MTRYEIVPRKYYRHPDGRTASLFGSHPGPGFELCSDGWTIYDARSGTYGAYGLPVSASYEQCQALVSKLQSLRA